jgi:hypothetical protein
MLELPRSSLVQRSPTSIMDNHDISHLARAQPKILPGGAHYFGVMLYLFLLDLLDDYT